MLQRRTAECKHVLYEMFRATGSIGRGKDCNSGRSNGCEWSQKGLHLSPKLLKTVALMAEIHKTRYRSVRQIAVLAVSRRVRHIRAQAVRADKGRCSHPLPSKPRSGAQALCCFRGTRRKGGFSPFRLNQDRPAAEPPVKAGRRPPRQRRAAALIRRRERRAAGVWGRRWSPHVFLNAIAIFDPPDHLNNCGCSM